MSKLSKIIVVLCVAIFFSGLVAFLIYNGNLKFSLNPQKTEHNSKSFPNLPQDGVYPELEEVKKQGNEFDKLKVYFQTLANKKGARYAYEVLKIAELPLNIDMHLLGHAVGDILYKQEGLNGITNCNNDFRNACSHSIVTGLFFDRGQEALADIADVCRKAPGGSGAYTMCFHGLGHGILAYVGYNMSDASALCQKTGTAERNYQESNQCISGAVMEIISGGFHDREKWEKQRPKFLNKLKPLTLCQQNFIPSNAQYLCYNYLTPYFFEVVGANPGNPISSDFEKAFKICEKLSVSDKSNREACFGGFGKEFVVLAQSRDTRLSSIAKISDQQLKQVYDWCALAGSKEGSAACDIQAMSSLYWGGENNSSIAKRFCGVMPDAYFQKSCFMNLIQSAFYYQSDEAYLQNFCVDLPEGYKQDCLSRIKMKN